MQSKAQMKLKFFEAETTIKKNCLPDWKNSTKDATELRWCQSFCMIVSWRKKSVYLHNSCKRKETQLIDLHENFERYCNTLPVFGFNSANYDIS